MAEAKKLLVPFEPDKPNWNPNDWLVAVNDGGAVTLVSLNTGREYQYGRVVFVGQNITDNDLFAKLVDSGRKVPNVADTLNTLGKFLDAMKTVKIGNVVEVVGGSENSITLVVASNTPSGFGK